MHADSITRRLARAALALRADGLPVAVAACATDLLGDLLVVAAAGQAEGSGQAFAAAIATAPGCSQVWFTDSLRSPADATFINTLNAGALDYDSLNGGVHADLVTLPAAWAMAQHCQRTPQQMLSAYSIASEVVSRLSRAASAPSKGWSGTALYGGIGAALASGLLLGLDLDTLTHALGLAMVQAAGTQQANIEQTLAKRLQPAFAARNGVQAALLAQAGATAPAQALEGRFGLRALYQPGDDGLILQGWGEQWQLLDTALKRYPVCACSHAAIQALLDLRADLPEGIDEVVQVSAFISPFMQRLVGGVFETSGDLQVVAQFNLQYQLASVLLRGPLNLSHLQPAAVTAPAIIALASRITVLIDPDNSHELAPATVRVTLRDGRRLEHTCRQLPGSPVAPLSHAEKVAKARECGQHARPELDGAALLHLTATVAQWPQLPLLTARGLRA